MVSDVYNNYSCRTAGVTSLYSTRMYLHAGQILSGTSSFGKIIWWYSLSFQINFLKIFIVIDCTIFVLCDLVVPVLDRGVRGQMARPTRWQDVACDSKSCNTVNIVAVPFVLFLPVMYIWGDLQVHLEIWDFGSTLKSGPSQAKPS